MYPGGGPYPGGGMYPGGGPYPDGGIFPGGGPYPDGGIFPGGGVESGGCWSEGGCSAVITYLLMWMVSRERHSPMYMCDTNLAAHGCIIHEQGAAHKRVYDLSIRA
jgi:hypothetical protein